MALMGIETTAIFMWETIYYIQTRTSFTRQVPRDRPTNPKPLCNRTQ
jgi:hypothetical protein